VIHTCVGIIPIPIIYNNNNNNNNNVVNLLLYLPAIKKFLNIIINYYDKNYILHHAYVLIIIYAFYAIRPSIFTEIHTVHIIKIMIYSSIIYAFNFSKHKSYNVSTNREVMIMGLTI